MAGVCSGRYSPFGRAMGVSAGSQRRQDRQNSEERRASSRKGWRHTLPGAKAGGSHRRLHNLRHLFLSSPTHCVGKTPPDFRGLAWRLGACPLKSGAIIFGLTHHPWNPEAEAHPCPHCCPLGQGLLIHWDPGAQSGRAPLRGT